MKIKRDSLHLFFDGDGAGGSSGTPPAAPPPNAPPAPPPPSPSPSTPPAPPATGMPPGNPPPAPPASGDPAPATLFGAKSPVASGNPPPPPAGSKAPDEAAIATFVDSVKIDLGQFQGKPVELNKDAVRAVAPIAMKHNLDATVMGELIAASAAFERQQTEAYLAQEKAEVAAAQQKVRTELGNAKILRKYN